MQPSLLIYVYLIHNLGVRWGWVVNDIPRQLYPQERVSVPLVQEIGWAPGPVWAGLEKIKSLATLGSN